MDYLYDGTFEGFLTCVYYHYYYSKADGIYFEKEYQNSFLKKWKFIKSESETAKKVYKTITEKISFDALKYAYYCFLSSDFNKEKYILNMLIAGFKTRKNIINIYTNPDITPLMVIAQKVINEKKNFLGLLRFSKEGEILFAEYEPNNNITELIMPHFAQRLMKEKFIIYDKKRDKAGIYYDENWNIVEMKKNLIPSNRRKDNISNIWKIYLEKISIKERKNEVAQYQRVPARYRKNITEFL